MLWFNLILFLCSEVVSLKQRKIKFKPRIKLNHNICKLSAQRSQKSYHSNLVTAHVRESGFRNLGNFVLVESGILRFGIRSTAVGIRNPALWNPEYSCRNPKSWALESGIQPKESGIPLTIEIQNPSSTDKNWNPVSGIRNPQCEVWKGRERKVREEKRREGKGRERKGREGKRGEEKGRKGKRREWKGREGNGRQSQHRLSRMK